MNVLQILPELHVGGVETGTVDLARELVKRGHKAVVISAGGPLVKDLESVGAKHYHLPVHKKDIITIIKNIRPIIEIIIKEDIHIVHARSRVPAWPAFFAARATKRVFITTCHGYYSRHIFSSVMGWGKRTIVLSNAIARHMIDDFGVPHEQIRLIPRSVDYTKFTFISPETKRKDSFNVGIIGRLTPLKGHMVFIKSIARAAREIPHLKAWIIGDAPASKESYKEQLHVLVNRLGLTQSTQFLGTQRDIPSVLNSLDVVVLATTTQEAFGRVVIEAQAAGVPVIATRVGGIVDIIEDGKTGLLVPAADPVGMGEALVRIYKEPALAKTMATAAFEKVKSNYTLDRMVQSTLDVYNDALSNFTVLIIKLSALGDVILTTAAIRSIKEKLGANHKVVVLVGQESKDVLLRCPYIDELIVCDPRGKDKGLRGILKVAASLRRKKIDKVVDLQNNRYSHLISRFVMAPLRYGYNNKKFSFLLNHGIPFDTLPIDPVQHQFRILAMLGIEPVQLQLELWPSSEDDSYVKELLRSQWVAEKQKLIGINARASIRWQTKNWLRQSLIKLCEELAKRDMRVVITGTEEDAAFANELIHNVKGAKPINACGKTNVNQLASLVRHCSVYVSTDSAPLHIAIAMKTPVVALFGPTDPRRHMPPAEKSVVMNKNISCAPCYKPVCKNVRCMSGITPEEVLAAIDKLLV